MLTIEKESKEMTYDPYLEDEYRKRVIKATILYQRIIERILTEEDIPNVFHELTDEKILEILQENTAN